MTEFLLFISVLAATVGWLEYWQARRVIAAQEAEIELLCDLARAQVAEIERLRKARRAPLAMFQDSMAQLDEIDWN